MTICEEWAANPTINPRTGRQIAVGKATYNALKAECAEKKSSPKKSTECSKWLADPTVNPRTGRKISPGKALYNALQAECGEKKSSPKKSQSPCDQWRARPNVNPRTGKFIQTGKGVYNALAKECGLAKRQTPPRAKTPPKTLSRAKSPPRARTPPRPKTPPPKPKTPPKAKTPPPQRKSPPRKITEEEVRQIKQRMKASEIWVKTSRSFDTSPLLWEPFDDEDEIETIERHRADYGDKNFALGREVNAYWLYTFVLTRLTDSLQILFPNGLKLKNGEKISAARAAAVLLASCYHRARRGCDPANPICLNVSEAKLVMNGVAENFLLDDSFAGADWALLGELTATLMNAHSAEVNVPQIAMVHALPEDRDVVILAPLIERNYILRSTVGFRLPGWQNLSEKVLAQKFRDQYTEREFVKRGMF
jgi:hypothetical protein